VTPLVGRIERALGAEVMANRTRPISEGWRLAPWSQARAAWRRALRAALRDARRGDTFAVADVRDCYGSITPETIESLLGPEAAPAVGFLRELRDRGVRGLPIGPEPSAVLANAALARLDVVLRAAGVRHLRWVDDVVLWGSRPALDRALAELHRVAARSGLDLHDRKTRPIEDREEIRSLAPGGRDSSIIAAP
jgi:hypothetical protein